MSDPTPLGRHMRVTPTRDGWLLTTRQGDPLGEIVWHAQWRQYELAPRYGSGFTSDCLRDLVRFLDTETAKRKAPKPALFGGDRG